MRSERTIPMVLILCIAPITLLSIVSSASAGAGWSIEFLVGVPLPFSSAMTIRQEGEPDIRLSPRFASRPFDRPLYYAVRIGRWDGSNGWEFEVNHDKLYLSNPPGEVEHFAVSHGFNRVTLNRVAEGGDLVRRAGAGAMITHPENTVRGRRLAGEGGILGTGYYLSGPTLLGGIGTRIGRRDGTFLPLEAMGTYSVVRMPVADGDAKFAIGGLHGLAGVGYGW